MMVCLKKTGVCCVPLTLHLRPIERIDVRVIHLRNVYKNIKRCFCNIYYKNDGGPCHGKCIPLNPTRNRECNVLSLVIL